jgi:hypothetical protein
MSTAWCLSVAFFVPWVVGVPVAWFARGCRRLRPGDWLWVPFFGLAAVVCPLQTVAVFADLPLARTAPWFWAATGAAWVVLLARPSGRASLGAVPWRVVALALAAYLGQGAGVVVRGVERYRGDLMSDQYSYVVLAQFLMDLPFSTDRHALVDHPWLALPLHLKPDRLGQSVAHGVIAVTAGRDALDTFFPTLLLGPALLVPAVLLLGTQCALPRRWAAWAAAAAALAPGVAVVVSLCYLSHALCIAVLVAFLAGVIRCARGGGWRPVPGTLATFVLGFSVYTEFAPLFVGVGGVALTAGVLRRHVSLARAAGVGAALLLSLGLNPAAAAAAWAVWERGTSLGGDMTTGHRTAVWVGAVWLHFEKAAALALMQRPGLTFSNAVLYVSGAAAALGGAAFVGRAVCSRKRLLPTLACAALLVPPAALWLIRPQAAYVVGKLVLTLTPVLVVFVAVGARAVGRHPACRRWRGAPAVVLAGFLLVLGGQSALEQRTWMRRTGGGGGERQAAVWNDPDLRHVCESLRASEPADVAIVLTNADGGPVAAVASGALCYSARHHRVRLLAPSGVWVIEPAGPAALPREVLADLRAGTLVVVRRGSLALPGTGHQIVLENGTYQVVRIGVTGARTS